MNLSRGQFVWYLAVPILSFLPLAVIAYLSEHPVLAGASLAFAAIAFLWTGYAIRSGVISIANARAPAPDRPWPKPPLLLEVACVTGMFVLGWLLYDVVVGAIFAVLGLITAPLARIPISPRSKASSRQRDRT